MNTAKKPTSIIFFGMAMLFNIPVFATEFYDSRLKSVTTNNSFLLATESKNATINNNARIKQLKKIAEGSVGWGIGHIGPLRSVKIDRLKIAFKETSVSDVPLLIQLLSEQDISSPVRQAIKYLISMYGEAAKAYLDHAEEKVEKGTLRSDYNDIRLYMKSPL
jgi:hypothetical protein